VTTVAYRCLSHPRSRRHELTIRRGISAADHT